MRALFIIGFLLALISTDLLRDKVINKGAPYIKTKELLEARQRLLK